jgi:hypothetical protein
MYVESYRLFNESKSVTEGTVVTIEISKCISGVMMPSGNPQVDIWK